MAIFGTASSPFFSITEIYFVIFFFENFTDSTTAHHFDSHTPPEMLGGADPRTPGEFQMNFPRGQGVGSKGPGSWGASFIQIEVCSWFFGVIFGDVGDVFGIVTWDCCERFFGGMNLKGLACGFLSRIPYESHVFDHLVRHGLCENKKNHRLSR